MGLGNSKNQRFCSLVECAANVVFHLSSADWFTNPKQLGRQRVQKWIRVDDHRARNAVFPQGIFKLRMVFCSISLASDR